MDVVGGDASVTAQKLPAIFAHAAVLHMIVLFLFLPFFLSLLFIFFFFLFGLPLYPLFLLKVKIRHRYGIKGNKETGKLDTYMLKV